ncbi:hypothetical protein P2P98_13105 [Microbacterium sp. Kw_RZR3]|uniref:hypothetical protein n=1 Tax=Microbacterium sp. Kw_RZR3 TaxID=3032903 RepID=UPI0023DA692F|nr:hypothetical protein [Microbacterium sp. Kw_RZR3]MDF2047099.1 hypothetical protein [Microbacterium sp. Kw_RZR3]
MSCHDIACLVADARRDITDADRCLAMHIEPSVGQLHRRLREVTDALAVLSSPPADDVREALTDVEALESLPTRSVVMDGGGKVWRKLVTGLWDCLDTNGDPPAEESHTVLWQSAPPRVAVLWRPAAEVRPYGTVTDAARMEYTIAAESENGAITQLADYTTVVREHLNADLELYRIEEARAKGNPDRIFIAERPVPKWVRS